MTEISTGITSPALSCVAALYALQNSMMLRPAAPRAGPTGGAGLALPASMASLMIDITARTRALLALVRRCGRCGLGVLELVRARDSAPDSSPARA